jgi:hypothetical protein
MEPEGVERKYACENDGRQDGTTGGLGAVMRKNVGDD